jgi:hypothetical protein
MWLLCELVNTKHVSKNLFLCEPLQSENWFHCSHQSETAILVHDSNNQKKPNAKDPLCEGKAQ